ncbi:TPA: hypothetical protein ACX6PJ_001579 [Photobacterium damselae]
MNVFIKKSLFKTVLLCTLLLSGCKGGEDGGENEVNSHSRFVTASIVDNYHLIPISNESDHKINLLNDIKLSDDYNIEIIDVKSLNNDKGCQIKSLDNTGFIFDGKYPIVCDYKYKISLQTDDDVKLAGDTEGYTRVLMSPDPEKAKLIPFGIIAYKGKTTVIDVQRELKKVGDSTSLDGYILNDDIVITPLDSTSNVTINSVDNTISYTPVDSSIINEQISYSLKNDEGDIFAGSFVVTISEEPVQGIDIKDKIEVFDVETNVSKPIDISPYVTNIDSDFQLIYVSSFGASVALTKEDNYQNKSFSFEAPMIGDYYVNAVVTDHRGGFDIALIRVIVNDPKGIGTWFDITDGVNTFLAPLTVADAMNDGVHYDSSYFDSATGINKRITQYTYKSAKDYCDLVGHLPSEDELISLYENQKPSLQGWPAEIPYWSDSINKVVNLSNGQSSATEQGNTYYLSCVVTDGFYIDKSESSISDVIANGGFNAKVVAKIMVDDKPVSGEFITASTPSNTSAVVQDKKLQTDKNGRVSFFVSNTIAETVELTLEHNADVRKIDIKFVADPMNVQISQITLVDNIVADGTRGIVETSLTDLGGNPVSGVNIKYSANNPNIFFVGDISSTNVDGKAYGFLYWGGSDTLSSALTAIVTSTYSISDTESVTASSYVKFSVAVDIQDLIIDKNFASVDDANSYNVVRAVIVNSAHDPVKDVRVDFSSDNPDCNILSKSVLTDFDGNALTSIGWTGGIGKDVVCNIKATVGKNEKNVDVMFVDQIYVQIDGRSKCFDKGFKEADADEVIRWLNVREIFYPYAPEGWIVEHGSDSYGAYERFGGVNNKTRQILSRHGDKWGNWGLGVTPDKQICERK